MSRKNRKVGNSVPDVTHFLDQAHRLRGGFTKVGDDHMAGLMESCLNTWEQAPIVLRADRAFLFGLMGTDRSFLIPDDVLDRIRYPALAVTLPEPIEYVHGGHHLTYHGFFAIGNSIVKNPLSPIRSGATRRVAEYMWGDEGFRYSWIDRGPFYGAHAIDFAWIATLPDGQAVVDSHTSIFRGFAGDAKAERSIASLTESGKTTSNSNMFDGPPDHLGDILALGVLVFLYLTAREPELDPVPRNLTQHQRRLHDVDVQNLGLRTGTALRQYLAGQTLGPGMGGWAMPPHIRGAHFQRYRVGPRDDWRYETLWKPPFPVNVPKGGTPPPVARDL